MLLLYVIVQENYYFSYTSNCKLYFYIAFLFAHLLVSLCLNFCDEELSLHTDLFKLLSPSWLLSFITLIWFLLLFRFYPHTFPYSDTIFHLYIPFLTPIQFNFYLCIYLHTTSIPYSYAIFYFYSIPPISILNWRTSHGIVASIVDCNTIVSLFETSHTITLLD